MTKRFNKFTIQGTPQMATDKEAIGLSRVHLYGQCHLPIRHPVDPSNKLMAYGINCPETPTILQLQTLVVFLANCRLLVDTFPPRRRPVAGQDGRQSIGGLGAGGRPSVRGGDTEDARRWREVVGYVVRRVILDDRAHRHLVGALVDGRQRPLGWYGRWWGRHGIWEWNHRQWRSSYTLKSRQS